MHTIKFAVIIFLSDELMFLILAMPDEENIILFVLDMYIKIIFLLIIITSLIINTITHVYIV